MCQSRLQTIYKPKHLCANCKKCFKDFDTAKNIVWGKVSADNYAEKRENGRKCPDCGQPMLRVSRDFRPPRQTKKKEWAAIKVLADFGHVPMPDHGCGCVWHPQVPKNVQQALDILENGRIYLGTKPKGDAGGFVMRDKHPLIVTSSPKSHMAV